MLFSRLSRVAFAGGRLCAARAAVLGGTLAAGAAANGYTCAMPIAVPQPLQPASVSANEAARAPVRLPARSPDGGAGSFHEALSGAIIPAEVPMGEIEEYDENEDDDDCEDESCLSEGEDSQPSETVSKNKRADPKWELLGTYEDRTIFTAALNARLMASGSLCGGAPKARPGGPKKYRKTDGAHVQVLMCAFCNTARCLARWQCVESGSTIQLFESAAFKHNDHKSNKQVMTESMPHKCACCCTISINIQPSCPVPALCPRVLLCSVAHARS